MNCIVSSKEKKTFSFVETEKCPGGGGGLITGCIFCLQVDGPINERGGLIIGGPIIRSLRYKRLSLNLAGFWKTLSPDGPFASNSPK